MTGTALMPVQAEIGSQLANSDTIIVPSGQPVTLHEVIWNAQGPEGLTLRFRFLAPQIARDSGTVDFNTAAGDMQALCENYALPRIAAHGPVPAQVIISLSDAPVPFGEARPEATQFFEAFTIKDGNCIWDAF